MKANAIRIVFGVFCLVMLGLMIWRLVGGVWTPLNWGMFAVAAVSCVLIFVNFVYVFNYSYGLCVALNSALIWLVLPSPVTALMASVGIIYGARLFWFTWKRMHSTSYAEKKEGIDKADGYVPKPIKVTIYIQCVLLHTFHLMALYFVALNAIFTPAVLTGIAIMAAGTLIEAVADGQKQAAKEQSPKDLVTSGLYARCRHPNYSGEILLHVGLIVAGLASVANAADAVVVTVAPLYIILLMISEALRVDELHETKYGDSEAYSLYRQNSGSLLPKI